MQLIQPETTYVSLRGVLCVAFMAATAHAQDRGAARLHAAVQGLTVTPRVLLIGARPQDADADLVAWLARGHHVQTGVLSLTRAESAPNYTGLESGATLGAIHVQETLAARAIDGGEQYFTRAYDFGPARSAEEAFAQWNHADLLGDVVAIVRAFRPHVIVARFAQDSNDRDGLHHASAIIAREVFDASLDTIRYPSRTFGMPWSPMSVYEPGSGTTLETREYDPVLGQTYGAIATESRSQLRSFGFAVPPWQSPARMRWRRIATRVVDSASTDSTSSLLAGIDTSFARLERDVPLEQFRSVPRPLVSQLPDIRRLADSARQTLDLEHPARSLPVLKRIAELAAAARSGLHGCRHPSRDAAVSLRGYQPCQPRWLDLDASLDLVQRRSADALLAAAGITVASVSDREFLASGDTALVTVTVANNGDSTVLLNDVSVSGAIAVRMTEPVQVPAHGSVDVVRSVTSIAYAHPWWIWKREKNFYPSSSTALDGVPRPGVALREFGIGGVAVPEDMRRLSDVTVTLTLGTTTLTSSAGSVVYKTADPMLGLRDRALSGVPAVTIGFERPLEWTQAGVPLTRQVRVTLRNFSDKPRRLVLKPSAATGAVTIDSVPSVVVLAPREAREVTLRVRGAPIPTRYDLGLVGITGGDTLNVGFRTAQYSYLPPLHFFRESNVSVLAVDVEIPARLAIAYVRGAGDDADVALKGLGIPVYVFNTEGLIRADLDGVSTVVVGPDALRVDRGLLTQMPRLIEFARRGGTVVVLGNPETITQPGVLPFPVGIARPLAEQVTRENAPVVAIDPRARLLTWPNVIRDADWAGWSGARAQSVPATADARYATVVETHDPGRQENRNSILVAAIGKGRVIYTSLTLTHQISNAVPGAMRVFVNLLSAGLPIEPMAQRR